MFINLITITFFSAVITFFMSPLTIILAKKYGLVDDPRKRPHPAHTHKNIIPRAGGLPIFLGIFLPLILLSEINQQIIGILLGGVILTLVGLWDDKKDRSPYIRFFTNCLAAIVVIFAGVGIPYITNPFGGLINLDIWKISIDFIGTHSIIILADILAFFWILWTTNIIGWSGGVDGQLPGFVSISAIVIGFLSLRYSIGDPNVYYVTNLSFLTAGAFLGFLPWNFYPQKIMPGYGGKTLAGFMLAVLSILSFGKLGTAILVLAVPMTDAFYILFSRILSGRSPVKASTGHLHHHLLNMGWSKRKIAVFYWVISGFAGVAALLLNSRQKLFAAVLSVVTIVGFIIWINLFRKFPKREVIEEI